jgi:hypothetical protein
MNKFIVIYMSNPANEIIQMWHNDRKKVLNASQIGNIICQSLHGELLDRYKKETIEYIKLTHSMFKTTDGNDDDYYNELLNLIDMYQPRFENDDDDVIKIEI